MTEPAPLALVVDSESAHTRTLVAMLEDVGFAVERTTELPAAGAQPALVLAAMDLPGLDVFELLGAAAVEGAIEVVLMAESDNPRAVRRAIAKGASYFFCRPYDEQFVAKLARDVLHEARDANRRGGARQRNALDQFGLLRGGSAPMQRLYRTIRKVAPTNANVLLIGESGTGKELVARTLHQMSAVADGDFVAVNCAALPRDLFESELFGHEKGSFTGAERRHRGYFERAHGGTLFLDEITEMPIELQAKLLRAIEDKTFARIGGEQQIEADARIIGATNAIPEDAIESGLLREDLYYRIASFPIHLPPLRVRGDDRRGLAEFFLAALNDANGAGKRLSDAAIEAIEAHDWPGNVREMSSVIERAFIVATDEILAEHLDLSDAPKTGQTLRITVGESIEDAERKLIFATLEANDGDKKATAATLGMSLRTLYSRLKHYAADDNDAD